MTLTVLSSKDDLEIEAILSLRKTTAEPYSLVLCVSLGNNGALSTPNLKKKGDLTLLNWPLAVGDGLRRDFSLYCYLGVHVMMLKTKTIVAFLPVLLLRVECGH